MKWLAKLFRRTLFWQPFPPSYYLRLTQPEEVPNLEMKKGLIALVQSENWHWFEKYMAWKMGVATREAFGSEGYKDDRFARDRRVEVGTFSEITQDMQQFWMDLKREEGMTREERAEERKGSTFDLPDFPS